MKLSTSKTELQTALQKLSKATPTRSTIPILSSVLFEVNKDGVIFKGKFNEIAGELGIVEINVPKNKIKGTNIGKIITKNKNFLWEFVQNA